MKVTLNLTVILPLYLAPPLMIWCFPDSAPSNLPFPFKFPLYSCFRFPISTRKNHHHFLVLSKSEHNVADKTTTFKPGYLHMMKQKVCVASTSAFEAWLENFPTNNANLFKRSLLK